MNFIGKALRILSLTIAMAGSILTVVQIFLLLFGQQTICFNDGCEIVESLTTVSPVIFNLAGLAFFQAVFWVLYYAKTKESHWATLGKAILLAGLGVEGVLVGYQHFVIEVFCSYCLVILGIVIALNLLQSLKHILYGIAIFLAIQIGFAGLQFSSPVGEKRFMLDKGTITTMAGPDKDNQFYLFFSSTCTHCEEVIETLEEMPSCSISFNPVDLVTEINLPEEHTLQSYDSDVNRDFLAGFDINTVPVLLQKNSDKYTVIRDKYEIINTIKENCYVVETGTSEIGTTEQGIDQFLPPQNIADENCVIDTDCE